MRKIENLTLDHYEVKDYFASLNRVVHTVDPVFITSYTNIQWDNKHVYYGRLYCPDGCYVGHNLTGVNMSVSGWQPVEVLFTELSCNLQTGGANYYQFIGYKILLQS